MSYQSFIGKVEADIETTSHTLLEVEWDLRNQIKIYKDPASSEKEKVRQGKTVEKCEQKKAMVRMKMDALEKLDPRISGNGNNLIAAYLDKLPANKKKIDLNAGMHHYLYSATTIPDLSKFTELTTLIMDCNERLCSGLERVPITVQTLGLHKTNFKTVEPIANLVNLKELYFDRNYELRALPDLSGMECLRTLDVSNTRIKSLPKLPVRISSIIISPNVKITGMHKIDWITERFEKYRVKSDDGDGLHIDRNILGGRLEEFICIHNRTIHFAEHREELLEMAAKIAMNPGRIARLVESGMDFDDVYERDNLFEYQ